MMYTRQVRNLQVQTRRRERVISQIPGCVARCHISFIESIFLSFGACKTIPIEPTTHSMQPTTPNMCKFSFRTKCASTALHEQNIKQERIGRSKKFMKMDRLLPKYDAQSSKRSNKYRRGKCICCKVGYLAQNHCKVKNKIIRESAAPFHHYRTLLDMYIYIRNIVLYFTGCMALVPYSSN